MCLHNKSKTLFRQMWLINMLPAVFTKNLLFGIFVIWNHGQKHVLCWNQNYFFCQKINHGIIFFYQTNFQIHLYQLSMSYSAYYLDIHWLQVCRKIFPSHHFIHEKSIIFILFIFCICWSEAIFSLKFDERSIFQKT
jgi:hypothetical protein